MTARHEPRQWRLFWTSLKHRNGFKAARHEGSMNITTAEATAGLGEALSSLRKWYTIHVRIEIYIVCSFGGRFFLLAASAGGEFWHSTVDTVICRLF